MGPLGQRNPTTPTQGIRGGCQEIGMWGPRRWALVPGIWSGAMQPQPLAVGPVPRPPGYGHGGSTMAPAALWRQQHACGAAAMTPATTTPAKRHQARRGGTPPSRAQRAAGPWTGTQPRHQGLKVQGSGPGTYDTFAYKYLRVSELKAASLGTDMGLGRSEGRAKRGPELLVYV